MRSATTVSLVLAGLGALSYLLLTRSGLSPGLKWPLFGVHLLALALAGGVAIWALAKREWSAAVPLALVAWFAWLQLAS